MGFARESCLFVDEKREGNPEKNSRTRDLFNLK